MLTEQTTPTAAGEGAITDHRPSIGASTPEPSVREIVRSYYAGALSDPGEAMRATDAYCARIDGLAAALVPRTTATPVLGDREAVRKLTMPNGDVLERDLYSGGGWASSWSIIVDGERAVSGEQDWELVERYGLSAILDAILRIALPASGTDGGGGWQPIETADPPLDDVTADLPDDARDGLGWAVDDISGEFAYHTWWAYQGGGVSKVTHWHPPIAGPIAPPHPADPRTQEARS